MVLCIVFSIRPVLTYLLNNFDMLIISNGLKFIALFCFVKKNVKS